MKSRKASVTCNSFDDLKELLKTKRFSLRGWPESSPPEHQANEDQELEEELFKKAMEGVNPIQRDNYVEKTSQIRPSGGFKDQEDAEILLKLKNLVRYGTGFNVSDTPEYVEGTGVCVPPSIAKRLHNGDFAIQAHIDLHGLCVEEAKDVFEKFLRWAVITGKKGILIVHGRGLSSPGEPVLKKKVIEWLTRGPWRKWVVAYSSARYCDGGAGATYVLLRKRPVTKRLRSGRLKLKGGVKSKGP